MTEEIKFDMKPVTSSQLRSVGYDIATKTLRIRFNDYFHKGNRVTVPGKCYDYDDVPPEEHAALMAADADPNLSVGQHFNTRIKGVYTYREQVVPGRP